MLQRGFCTAIITLILAVRVTRATECKNRLDIVIAVDTTSSQTASSFNEFKAEVNGIVSGFVIGQNRTRLALISMHSQAQVVLNLDGVNSIADFNAAVDRLAFSSDTVNLAEAMKVAKDSVFVPSATPASVHKILILVKDRRFLSVAVSAATVLSQMRMEATYLKELGVAIHVTGFGGLWDKLELEALFGGTDYVLFKNKNKALEFINPCPDDCPDKVKTEKSEYCLNGTKHIITTTASMVKRSDGVYMCQKEISRDFARCSEIQACNSMSRDIGSCGPDRNFNITSTWDVFSNNQQTCVKETTTDRAACVSVAKDTRWFSQLSHKCDNQVIDVIYILDSCGQNSTFEKIKTATRVLVGYLNVNKDKVHVGVMKIAPGVVNISVPLGTLYKMRQIINHIDQLPTYHYHNGGTVLHLALDQARLEFESRGRRGVSKFAFLITKGEDADITKTLVALHKIRNAGVKVFVIGMDQLTDLEMDRLRLFAAPDVDNQLSVHKHINTLFNWSVNFSMHFCKHLVEPPPKLCEEQSFVRTISPCISMKQYMVSAAFKFNAQNKCTKEIKSTEIDVCADRCVSPTDGNHYSSGETWTSLCHEFLCPNNVTTPLLPIQSKCMAFDGSCKDANSPPFKCRDELGVVNENCQCAYKNGKAVILIDRT